MNRRQTLFALTLIICVGFALRIFQLDAVSLRGDEAFTVMNWGQQPLALTLDQIATIDPHPPLAYTLFRAWALVFGTTEFTMRLLPALVNVLGVAAIYALGKHIDNRTTGLLAALIWAVNPFQIWHAQDVRNYAIWAALSPIAAWLALRLLARGRRVDFFVYLIAAVITAYIYYLELFSLVVLNTYAVIVYFRNHNRLKMWFSAQALLVLSLLSWFLQPRLLTGSGYGGTAGNANPVALLTWFIPELSFGSTLPYEILQWLPVPLLSLMVLAAVVLWQKSARHALFLMMLGLLPLLMITIVSLRLNVFVPRYVLSAAPAYTVLVAWFITELFRQNNFRRIAGAVIALVWISIELLGLYCYFFVNDYAKAPDWRALNTYLEPYTTSEDLVINMSVDAAFGFYYDGVAQDIGLPTAPTQSHDELMGLLQSARTNPESVWTVGQSIPSWPNATLIPEWLHETYQEVWSFSTPGGLPIHQYMPWKPVLPESEPLSQFINTAQLIDVEVRPPLHAGMDLTVWLYWQPTNQTTSSLKAFVHLIGEQLSPQGSTIWTQDDQLLQDGRDSTTSWEIGSIYRDVFVLPMQDVSEGAYHLEIGLYNPETSERVLNNEGEDRVALDPLMIIYSE